MKTDKFVTISIDDGHPSDLRTRDLLNKYGLRATFYVPARNQEREVLSTAHIRELGEEFEIGAHTYNHVPLTRLPLETAWDEIKNGKSWLENVLTRPVESFCYPRGKYNRKIAALVKRAGFIGARTCLFNLNDFPKDAFCWGVSTHASSHSAFIQIRHAMLELNLAGALHYFTTFKAQRHWVSHFEGALNAVEKKGGVAHLYLHSWEIENGCQWAELDASFRSISQRKHLTNVTNGELYQLWNTQHGCNSHSA